MVATPARKRSWSRLPRQQREADILQAARAEFCAKGYDAAMIADIAAQAGVVEGTIYKYFQNKRDLLIRVVEQWYQGMVDANQAQIRMRMGARNRLHFVILQHLTAIRTEPDLCRLVFSEIRTAEEYRNTNIAQWMRRYTQVALDVVTDGIDTGECRADLPLRFVRDMIYGTMEHCTWSYLNGGDDFDPLVVADELTELIFRAIGTPDMETRSPGTEISQLQAATDRLQRIADQLEQQTADRIPSHEGDQEHDR